MVYLSIEQHHIRLLYLKKSLLGQFETQYYEKNHQVDLLKDGSVVSADLLASAVKEALATAVPNGLKEKELTIILPQEAFSYFRTEVPSDMANSAVVSFVLEKAQSKHGIFIDESLYDFVVHEEDKEKQILFYALKRESFQNYQDALSLLNLEITAIVPDTLSYFKLFEKTLRKDKKEIILYTSYGVDRLFGYLYDSFGLLVPQKLFYVEDKTVVIEDVLKKIGQQYEAEGKKINRLILSGDQSETVRQDMFTKHIGIWTNPLKRIIPQFYQEYAKLLVTESNAAFPFLNLDVCFGAFIFSLENKTFSLLKKKGTFTARKVSRSAGSRKKLPIKEIGLFVASFALSFALFVGISNMKIPFPKLASFSLKPSPTATPSPVPTSEPTATPTPSIDRKTLRVKILNGSGTKGRASDVKDVLKEKNYLEILTANADSFDYETTEIQTKKSKPEVASVIVADLKDNVASPKLTTLPEKDPSDIIIIIGKDFK
ncbi:hypothetical protein HGA88_00915 [Candidatus Roizmanbacteria bacterium]|nr:hypothetical protein [Candidatus Roizmanbacteria bacterium]